MSACLVSIESVRVDCNPNVELDHDGAPLRELPAPIIADLLLRVRGDVDALQRMAAALDGRGKHLTKRQADAMARILEAGTP